MQHPATSVSAPFRDHLGPWAAPVAHNKVQGKGGDVDDAPLLLQKARWVPCSPRLGVAAFGQYLEVVSFAPTAATVVFPRSIGVRSPSLSGSSTALLLARRGAADFSAYTMLAVRWA